MTTVYNVRGYAWWIVRGINSSKSWRAIIDDENSDEDIDEETEGRKEIKIRKGNKVSEITWN